MIPDFNTKKELFSFLHENKAILIAEKKATMKKADAFSFAVDIPGKTSASKAETASIEDANAIAAKVVMNTTNLMDSHDDVHFPGIWTKTLKENKNIMHIQEHKMAFDSIISDGSDLSAKVQNYSWKELGYGFQGDTQALIFNSTIKRNRNEYMFKQYADGNVKNHSVGMQYVKIFMAINDQDYKEEFDIWNKYIDKVANRDVAEQKGYFWAVTEAKLIEGSAVPVGSNYATPTLEVNPKQSQSTAGQSQENGTEKNISIIENFKFI